MRSRVLAGALLAIMLVLGAAACGDDDDDAGTTNGAADGASGTSDDGAADDGASDDGSAVAGEGVTITIDNFDFGEPVTVAAGQTVTVQNDDGPPHTWTAVDESFDSEAIASGASYEHTFDAPGSYDFFCKFHPSMTGSITVTG
ncbi:MAG: cupredoxin domain-containing protein [Acidimicrobiales bacterium]|nr:cupredoxin domain-containing protein [Acidimicrobiales bacterium]